MRSRKEVPDNGAEQEVDVHILTVPQSLWRAVRNIHSSICTKSVSAGFVRVCPGVTLAQLKNEVSKQLDSSLLPDEYTILRSVGHRMTWVSQKQETELKVRLFLPPIAPSPEIYVLNSNFLEGTNELPTVEAPSNDFRSNYYADDMGHYYPTPSYDPGYHGYSHVIPRQQHYLSSSFPPLHPTDVHYEAHDQSYAHSHHTTYPPSTRIPHTPHTPCTHPPATLPPIAHNLQAIHPPTTHTPTTHPPTAHPPTTHNSHTAHISPELPKSQFINTANERHSSQINASLNTTLPTSISSHNSEAVTKSTIPHNYGISHQQVSQTITNGGYTNGYSNNPHSQFINHHSGDSQRKLQQSCAGNENQLMSNHIFQRSMPHSMLQGPASQGAQCMQIPPPHTDMQGPTPQGAQNMQGSVASQSTTHNIPGPPPAGVHYVQRPALQGAQYMQGPTPHNMQGPVPQSVQNIQGSAPQGTYFMQGPPPQDVHYMQKQAPQDTQYMQGPPQGVHNMQGPVSQGVHNMQGPPQSVHNMQGPPQDVHNMQGPVPQNAQYMQGPPQGVHNMQGPVSQGVHNMQGPPQDVHNMQGPVPQNAQYMQGPPQGVHNMQGPPQGVHNMQGPPQGVHNIQEPPQGAHIMQELAVSQGTQQFQKESNIIDNTNKSNNYFGQNTSKISADKNPATNQKQIIVRISNPNDKAPLQQNNEQAAYYDQKVEKRKSSLTKQGRLNSPSEPEISFANKKATEKRGGKNTYPPQAEKQRQPNNWANSNSNSSKKIFSRDNNLKMISKVDTQIANGGFPLPAIVDKEAKSNDSVSTKKHGSPNGKVEMSESRPTTAQRNDILGDIRKLKGKNEELGSMKAKLSSALRTVQIAARNQREKNDNEWKRKYFQEKKISVILEEKKQKIKNNCLKIEHELKKIQTKGTLPKPNYNPLLDPPSETSNVKILCRKYKNDVEHLRMRLNTMKLHLSTEREARRSAVDECKALREELMQMKISQSRRKTKQVQAAS